MMNLVKITLVLLSLRTQCSVMTLGNSQSNTSAAVIHTIQAPEKHSATLPCVHERQLCSNEELRTVALLISEVDNASEYEEHLSWRNNQVRKKLAHHIFSLKYHDHNRFLNSKLFVIEQSVHCLELSTSNIHNLAQFLQQLHMVSEEKFTILNNLIIS